MLEQVPADDGRTIIGWREYVNLPEWGIAGMLAKIDTGARTSAIHVENVQELAGDRVRFEVVQSLTDRSRHAVVETEQVRIAAVRVSTGQRQHRIVVATRIQVGPVCKEVELSIVCRRHMLCRMLLGRTALEPEFLVAPGAKYLFGRPKGVRKRKRNG